MKSRIKMLRSGTLLLLVFGCSTVAADVDVIFEAGVGHTNNINRANDSVLNPAVDDTIYSAGMEIIVEHESARAEADVRGSLFWHDYQDGPYESETLPALDATAIFRITDQALSWFVFGNVGQLAVDPFQPVTPGNRQDITYLTTGPSLFIPFGARFSLRANAWYSDVQYETQPFDNARQGGQLSFARQINPTRSLSLNMRTERTEFDLDSTLPPIERYDTFMQFSTEGSRNDLTVDLGFSSAERSGNKTEEPLVGVDWQRQISPATSFNLAGGTRISDSADSFRGNQQGSTDIGQAQIQQDITDTFREDYLSVALAYDRPRTSVSAGVRWSDEDYEETLAQRNRRVRSASLSLSRQLGQSWSAGLFGSIQRLDYDTLDRRDDDIDVGARLTWSQFRTLEIELQLNYFERDSSDFATEFNENRAYLRFRYVPTIG